MSAALFVMALAPRLVYLAVARPAAQNYFWALADSLLRDGSLSIGGSKTTAYEPLYPLFLAVCRALVGDRVQFVQAIQCVVGAAGGVLLYRLSVTLTGRATVGVLAAAMYAVYPLLIRYAGTLFDPTLMAVLVLGFVAAFVNADTAPRAAAAGVWLGLAILTRSMVAPLVPLGAAILWRERGSRIATAFTATVIIVVAPYALRTYALSGGFVPTRSGLNLFISNCEYTAGILPDYGPDLLEDYAMATLERRAPVAGPPSPVRERAEDSAYTRLAFEHVAADPMGTLALKLRSVWYLFSPSLIPSRDPSAEMTFHADDHGGFSVDNSRPRPALDRWVYTFSYVPVAVLAIVGVWLRRRHLRADAMLWGTVATFAIVHAIYFPTTRYRVPIEFTLLFYSAVAIDRTMRRSVESSEKKSGSETNQPANAVFGAAPSTSVTQCST